MSVQVQTLIWRHYPNGREMLTAIALADVADDNGYCVFHRGEKMDAQYIADKTLQSIRAVRYHLQTMQEIGWLKVVENAQGGRGKRPVYQIPVENIPRGCWERLQKLQPLILDGTALDNQTQDVVSGGSESLQKLPPLNEQPGKVANPAVKVASFDAKGGKSQHPSNMGYVVHKSTSIPSAGADEFPGFTRFWNLWPKTARKGGKSKCLAIWKRKGYEASTDAILAHIEKMKASEGWRTGFDPMPTTYLNRQDWDGADLDAPASGQKPWFINGWSSFIEHGKKHGLLEGDFDAPPDFRAAVLKAEGITPEQIQKAEAEWRAH